MIKSEKENNGTRNRDPRNEKIRQESSENVSQQQSQAEEKNKKGTEATANSDKG